ncbi:hypothetical protein ACFFF5_19375 [Lederbergia wuyishanensis]|uniref:Uncharacterized protein n=1 Tax=Lederbergia wuyishanensis TaxID=1347903 RepID=A0ABU0D594_9BACI|nr:hypothetical protein [Lederbergia wuyishanensis]MCJ8009884.1 hypothetical protein [Lederbergia wuyishanensis]MDQ0343579.1 hypothetical protein [Lederbergia wuyishanensis]
MKKKRLLIYLFLFFAIITVVTVQGRTSSQQFSPDKVTSYVNGVGMGIQDLYKKVPINDIRESNTISKSQLDHLIGGIDRVFSSYSDLKTMGINFHFIKEDEVNKTDFVLEHIFSSLLELKNSTKGDIVLTKKQMDVIEELYIYLWDIYQLEIYDKELNVILLSIEDVSKKYEALGEVSFQP